MESLYKSIFNSTYCCIFKKNNPDIQKEHSKSSKLYQNHHHLNRFTDLEKLSSNKCVCGQWNSIPACKCKISPPPLLPSPPFPPGISLNDTVLYPCRCLFWWGLCATSSPIIPSLCVPRSSVLFGRNYTGRETSWRWGREPGASCTEHTREGGCESECTKQLTTSSQLGRDNCHGQLYKDATFEELLPAATGLHFYAWDSSPHLRVIPAQMTKLGIGRNASCTVGDFT